MYEAYTIITQEVYEQYPNGIPHDQFPGFENYAQFTPQQAFPGPPTPPNQHPGAVQPIINGPRSTQSSADVLAIAKMEAEDQAQARRQGSNSEEDELTPAQSRRKAQNRAAYVDGIPSYLVPSSLS